MISGRLSIALAIGVQVAFAWTTTSPSAAQDDNTPPPPPPVPAEVPAPTPPPASVEESAPPKLFDTRIYGFINSNLEKVADTPAGVDAAGDTIYQSNPHEFDVLNLNVMVQGTVAERYRYFLNVAAPGSGSVSEDKVFAVRNAWLEAALLGNYLAVRFGKTYRRFGLYNEILDAIPTFIGIETPELLDKDHLMVTRTTNLMLFGQILRGPNNFSWSLATGNDESASGQVPLGADLRYDYMTTVRLGVSFYTTLGTAAPTRAVGEGSPAGGVINWMAEDEYFVIDAYFQLTKGPITFQTEYAFARHDARRDPASVLLLLGGGLNDRQKQRFGLDGPTPMESDVIVPVEYDVHTAYLRAGYELVTDHGDFTPYVQLDWYRNPETIAAKDLGGDDEAGLTDDGQFIKSTLGVVYRPIPVIALKVDGSTHTQKFNGETITYPEIRISLSYFWEL